jgi:hypothetical protein
LGGKALAIISERLIIWKMDLDQHIPKEVVEAKHSTTGRVACPFDLHAVLLTDKDINSVLEENFQ